MRNKRIATTHVVFDKVILCLPIFLRLLWKCFLLCFNEGVRNSDLFMYHRYCSKMELINLCFANDLLLFAHGDVNSARVIMDTLDEFKLASGLTPSLPKSTAYFCNVLNHTKISILHVLPFEEGRLPVKYLGVPLVAIDSLGRLKKGRAKVSWDLVCRPRNEGGLRIRFVKKFDVATVWETIHPHYDVVPWHDVVWDQMKGLAGLSNVTRRYKEIVDYIIPFAKRRSCKSVIAKLVLSASTYYDGAKALDFDFESKITTRLQNRFHVLVLCSRVVSTEKKNIEKGTFEDFPRESKECFTSSKAKRLCMKAINMAQELIEQGVQAKELRIVIAIKRKWE
ncbi:hypothetical protein Tco_0822626 [Tanacetum coccineum]|uniref:Reverse transcriptase domain-containing protein n=1 Tax=Tanacetum coccineum TaxID=301880 RepID=A0ABQ5AI78_9ASTR